MTNICKNCGEFFNNHLIKCCTCGIFCSDECMNDYHKKREKEKK